MHEVIARYEHMCDGSMQLPCLPAPFYPSGGVARRGRRTGVRTGGRTGAGGGEDVMEASVSSCGRLVFTAKFPSIHGHTATTRTKGSSGVSRDAGASHATPAYAAAASEQAAGPNREWTEDTPHPGRCSIRRTDSDMRDNSTSMVVHTTLGAWAVRFQTSSSSPGLPSSPPSSP